MLKFTKNSNIKFIHYFLNSNSNSNSNNCNNNNKINYNNNLYKEKKYEKKKKIKEIINIFTAWKSLAVFQRVRLEAVKSAEPPISSGIASHILLRTISDNFLLFLYIIFLF